MAQKSDRGLPSITSRTRHYASRAGFEFMLQDESQSVTLLAAKVVELNIKR
jgi:hypothetical protein